MSCMCLKYYSYFNVYLCQSLFHLKIVRLNIVLCLSLTSIITMLVFFIVFSCFTFFLSFIISITCFVGPKARIFSSPNWPEIKFKRDPTAGHEERLKGAS